MGTVKIHNTLSGRKEEFVPLVPGKASMYACGVTVYDHCHIGHARSAVIFDMVRRYLGYRGFEVTYVRNFTDIDDKIINRARREGISWNEVAAKYTEEYRKDMEKLGVAPADIEPKATDNIREILDIVGGLVQKGFAYESGGSVYFSVESFAEYGRLSKRDKEELMAGARVEVDERKRNPLDFVLWKESKEGEPSWESPWGPGRPGWHIECTAMSIKYLGDSFDIHGGGADLLFPHHENEVAQSEAYTGKPFVRYWIHNGFITIDKEKMSKSLGNFFTIKEVLDKFDPEVLRFFLLSTHYRSPIEFSDELLREAENTLDRYYTTAERIGDLLKKATASDKEPSEAAKLYDEFQSGFLSRFEEAMDDDFNSALALGHIFELIREANRFLDRRPSGRKEVALLAMTEEHLRNAGEILSLFQRTPREWYRSLIKTKGIGLTEEEVENRISARERARQTKDWAAADAIRKELDEQGIALEDKKDGTIWRVKTGSGLDLRP